MTTAAPPEKMTNAELAVLLENQSALLEMSYGYECDAIREAGRRLSAPAPAAPRVGDDVRTNFFDQCPDGWYHAFARVEKFRVTVVDREMGKEPIGGPTLSAPPAASADDAQEINDLALRKRAALPKGQEHE